MRSEEFVNLMRSRSMSVFSSADAERALGKGTKYTSLFLRRLAHSGRISAIERGKYYVAGTDSYAVASNIVYPSYVSLFSAFRYHRITTQNVIGIDIVSPKPHAEIKCGDDTIRFATLPGSKIFGFYRDKETGAFVATIEKAVVDSLYLRNPPIGYVVDALEAAAEDRKLYTDRLHVFAHRMGSRVLLQRLEGACKEAGVDVIIRGI